MARTTAELERAAAGAMAALDKLDWASDPTEDASDLRRIGQAVQAGAADARELEKAVLVARAGGRSWGMIATAMGVSRQAARERFSKLAGV